MDAAMAETKEKVRRYYEKVGQLNIDPFDIPETPDEIELYVGWFFDRVRSIVSIENSRRKFGSMEEVLALLGEAAGDLGMSIKFTYYKSIGQLYLEFNDAGDYLNLPQLAKHFGMLYRFKWRPDTLPTGGEWEAWDTMEVVHEGNGDEYAYVRSERGVD